MPANVHENYPKKERYRVVFNKWYYWRIIKDFIDLSFYPYSKGTLALNRSMYIVIEWAEYGYLELFLEEDIAFPWSERIKISQQIASAIQFCHNNHILHHNLRR